MALAQETSGVDDEGRNTVVEQHSEDTEVVTPKRSLYRSVPFQIAIACAVSVTAPGMWDALGGLGAGGAAEPSAVSAANALVYGLFAVVCVVAGAVNNRIGLKYGLAIGAVGYPLYGAGLYTNNTSSNTWFLLFGSTICGISAGFFWAAEATIIIGYPSPHERAFYLAIWTMARNIGPIVGGAINLGVNVQRNFSGSVSSVTYIIFITIMCLGLPIALCLSPAQKVWRKNNMKVIVETQPGWKAEFLAVGKLFKSRHILYLLPIFFSSYFYLGYQSTYLTVFFTVRARALSSLITYFAGIFSSFLIALLLDRQSIPLNRRAQLGFGICMSFMLLTWVWASIMQAKFQARSERPVIDWDDEDFKSAYPLIFCWLFGGQALQQFLYWFVGQYASNLSSMSHHTGIFRGVEALGQTVAWAMQTPVNISHWISIGLNIGLYIVSIPTAWIIISELEHTGEIEVQQDGGLSTAKAVDEEPADDTKKLG